MVGWAAVTGDVGLASVALFAIIFMWTPPHFWALSLYRANDYARRGVPMLPVVAGPESTRRHILAYTLALLPVSLLPVALGFAGVVYAVIALAFGGGFVLLAPALARPDAAHRDADLPLLDRLPVRGARRAGARPRAGLADLGGVIW